MELKKTKIFGLDFLNEHDLSLINAHVFRDLGKPLINGHELPIIFTPNVDYLVKLDRPDNKYIQDFLKKSKYILPDGQPIIWASKLTRERLITRLTGSDLFPLMFSRAQNENIPILLLTSNEKLADFYRGFGDNVCAHALPLIKNNNIGEVADNIISMIEKSSIKIVFIGIGFPNQDLLCMEVFDRMKKKNIEYPLVCLFGAALSFFAGHERRAPKLYQNVGMEWFYRFSKEPKRLFKRYFIDSMRFFKLLYEMRKSK